MEFPQGVYLGCKHPLVPPLMNGGGCCKTVDHVRELSRSLAGAILIGSFTKEERMGNSGNVWWVGSGAALNSLGMPNGGEDYLKAHLSEMVTIAHDAGKILVVNVAGDNSEEYASLTALSFDLGADAVEENLGCPNVVKDDGSRKPIASFDIAVMEEIISTVQREVGREAAVWVKVSPYSDPDLLKKSSAVISVYEVVKAVTAVNTFPSAYGLDDHGNPVISVGLAGLSGRALKHIGLGQIKQWRDVLPGQIGLIAAGGISTGQDIADYRLVGANGFQMTTELLRTGNLNPGAFGRVALEYSELPSYS